MEQRGVTEVEVRVSRERLNQLLADLGETPMAEQDYKPVRAA